MIEQSRHLDRQGVRIIHLQGALHEGSDFGLHVEDATAGHDE
jgi:hypothetical protein